MPKRDAAVLEHGANANSELFFAAVAAPAEVGLALAGLAVLHLVHIQIAAARAGRMIAPTLALHELHSGLLIRTRYWKGFDNRIALGRAVLYFGFGIHG